MSAVLPNEGFYRRLLVILHTLLVTPRILTRRGLVPYRIFII